MTQEHVLAQAERHSLFVPFFRKHPRRLPRFRRGRRGHDGDVVTERNGYRGSMNG